MKTVSFCVGYVIGHSLYFCGNTISRIVDVSPDIIVDILYPVYNQCMRGSVYFSERYNLGLW